MGLETRKFALAAFAPGAEIILIGTTEGERYFVERYVGPVRGGTRPKRGGVVPRRAARSSGA